MLTQQAVGALEKHLWPRGERRDVWMILDGARSPRIFSMLLACHLDYLCLYSGLLPSPLNMAAPYLVQLEYEYADTRRFLKNAWGNSWGIFIRSDSTIRVLRRHLRSLLLVQDQRGRRMLFRYYDPRVLRLYLPTCTAEELRTVFGPVDRFWLEDKSGDGLLEFGLEKSALSQKERKLEAVQSGSAVSSKRVSISERPR